MSKATATISGNLTRPLELRFTGGGTAIASGTIASEHRYKDTKTDEWVSTPSFFDFTIWGKPAEEAAALLAEAKGQAVIATGRLEQQSWDDKDTGAKRSKIVLVVDELALLARGLEDFTRKSSSGNGASRPNTGRSVGSQQYQDEEPF